MLLELDLILLEIGSDIAGNIAGIGSEVGGIAEGLTQGISGAVSSISGAVSGGVLPAVKATLATLTEDSTVGDETPFGLILTAGLGIATLFTEFGELFEKHPVVASFQSAPIAGI